MDTPDTPQSLCLEEHLDPVLGQARHLRQSGRPAEAVQLLREWLKLRPGTLVALEQLGQWLEADGFALEGARYTCEAYVLRPADGQPPRMRGLAFYLLGRHAEAAQVYRDWLAREPDNPVARHFVAAFTGQDTPDRASPGFVQRSFDAFAPDFNQRLRQLGYRIPEQMADWLQALDPLPAQWSVLDAGCGTGLAGPLLRPWAARLIGVDLSARMLDEAHRCGVYDELLVADLLPHLQGLQACHDLIVLADTLVYFGDTAALLAGCGQALRPGGHLILSTELMADDETDAGAGHRLAPTGRYQHRRGEIARHLEGAGLVTVRSADLPVRLELGQAVAGQLLLARKPGP
ncbi:MAG: methyltransferase domain-containing protein [Curvibacter sp.]|nr:methyltransferase domain-containing protein [Curvibacter sp.]